MNHSKKKFYINNIFLIKISLFILIISLVSFFGAVVYFNKRLINGIYPQIANYIFISSLAAGFISYFIFTLAMISQLLEQAKGLLLKLIVFIVSLSGLISMPIIFLLIIVFTSSNTFSKTSFTNTSSTRSLPQTSNQTDYTEPGTNYTQLQSDIANPQQEEWGIAKQIDEVTWQMKVNLDDRIGTPEEIYEALNSYRNRHGVNSLNWDNNLAVFAQQRADYFNSIQNIDKHAGFNDFVSSYENITNMGFRSIGENSSFGYRMYGVHLIEWIFAGDEPHNANQLNSGWNHVGIGVSGLGVDLIFGYK